MGAGQQSDCWSQHYRLVAGLLRGKSEGLLHSLSCTRVAAVAVAVAVSVAEMLDAAKGDW